MKDAVPPKNKWIRTQRKDIYIRSVRLKYVPLFWVRILSIYSSRKPCFSSKWQHWFKQSFKNYVKLKKKL